MLTADRLHAPAAVCIDIGAILVSMELSKSTWLITSLSPGAGERIGQKHRPEQTEAELRSGLRIGRDGARIIVGRAGHEPGTELFRQRDAAQARLQAVAMARRCAGNADAVPSGATLGRRAAWLFDSARGHPNAGCVTPSRR